MHGSDNPLRPSGKGDQPEPEVRTLRVKVNHVVASLVHEPVHAEEESRRLRERKVVDPVARRGKLSRERPHIRSGAQDLAVDTLLQEDRPGREEHRLRT